MLRKQFLLLVLFAQQVIDEHKALVEEHLVWVLGRELVVQLLEDLLGGDFEDLEDARVESEVLGELDFLDVALLMGVAWLFLLVFALDALEDLLDELLFRGGLGRGWVEEIRQVAVGQNGLVLMVQLALVDCMGLS